MCYYDESDEEYDLEAFGDLVDIMHPQARVVYAETVAQQFYELFGYIPTPEDL